ncbi:hypothetical protein CSA17_03260 [bacterium DOLJORAL78_65_58]|nr:MAG: hypothetical protein CSB20_14010 [bacterium DOLZORAL124_64_63]PIE76236.1 MAG: hypothetical protein CSA17_03260 [bacterium DOLJORAL78_65_58]
MNATLMQPLAEKTRPEVPGSTRLLRGYLHKTSNSLCGIKGYAGLIAAQDPTELKSGRWARKILAEIERLEDLLRNVGDLTMRRHNFTGGRDLAGVLGQAVAQVREQHPGLTAVVRSLPDAELLLPESDLALVLKEVLQNSAQARERVLVEITGQVEITGRVTLRLEDNGPGMEPELLKMAAEPFVTTREGHHGVGLTRLDTLCEMHGLAWSLASHPGTGTTVTLEVARALESIDHPART